MAYLPNFNFLNVEPRCIHCNTRKDEPCAKEGQCFAYYVIKPAPAKPYACHNKPRPVAGAVTHYGKNGWDRYGPFGEHYRPRFVPIHHTMSTDCRYDKHATDPRCAGCQHIKAAP